MRTRVALALMLFVATALLAAGTAAKAGKPPVFTVIVQDQDTGKLLAGALVEVWSVKDDPDGRLVPDVQVAAGVTDRKGKAQIGGLAPYTAYFVYATPPRGERAGPEPVFTNGSGGGTWYFRL